MYFYKIYQLIDYSINDNYLKNQIDFLNNINGKKRKSEEQEHKKYEIWNRNQRELQKNLRKELKSQLNSPLMTKQDLLDALCFKV